MSKSMKGTSPYPVLDNRPIDQWKVTELKEELKKRKLVTKGLKEDLIKRLNEALQDENDTEPETTNGNDDGGVNDIPEPVVEAEDEGVLPDVSETSDVMGPNATDNKVDDKTGQDPLDISEDAVGEAKVTDDGIKGGPLDITEDAVGEAKVSEEEIEGGPLDIIEDAVGEARVPEEEIKGGSISSGDEYTVVHVTSVETITSVTETVVSEIIETTQESETLDSHSKREDLKPLLENEEVNPPIEELELHSSDANNQVSEVSTVLGFKVSSDSISSDCISINEKNELKDNIIADDVKLELDVKPEMVQPSSITVTPDGGDVHPMDVEEPHENKAVSEEIHDDQIANAEIIKNNDNADVVSSEKINLDRSSGDDSMEEDALESKQIDSKNNSDEVGDRSEKIEKLVAKEEAPVVDMHDNISAETNDNHEETKDPPAAPVVKRKLHGQEVVGNNETFKRQRRWNSEKLNIPEPQSNMGSSTTPKDTIPSTTPKDPLTSTTLKRNFSRSNSTTSEDATPKERIVPPSSKPPTTSLKIDRFLRPFTLKAVQDLLGKTGIVTSFWMDQIKTHCYVTYATVEEAVETRNAVYNLQWPTNGGRLLVAEFVDPQEVKTRVEAPPPSPATPASTGPKTPTAAPALQQPQPSPRQPVQKQQLQAPPAPSLPPPPPLSNPPPVRERLQLPPPPPLPEKVDPPIVTLDDLFRKTKATPRIYYLPLSDEQVAAKLKSVGRNNF